MGKPIRKNKIYDHKFCGSSYGFGACVSADMRPRGAANENKRFKVMTVTSAPHSHSTERSGGWSDLYSRQSRRTRYGSRSWQRPEAYLEVAMAASKTELVFPNRDGRLLSRGVQLEKVLRRALQRANIVTGYEHRCRRKSCRKIVNAPDDEIRWCPKCKMKLWPVSRCARSASTTFAIRPPRC